MTPSEYLNLPKNRDRVPLLGDIYCPDHVRNMHNTYSNPKAGDLVLYMEVTKVPDEDDDSVHVAVKSTTLTEEKDLWMSKEHF